MRSADLWENGGENCTDRSAIAAVMGSTRKSCSTVDARCRLRNDDMHLLESSWQAPKASCRRCRLPRFAGVPRRSRPTRVRESSSAGTCAIQKTTCVSTIICLRHQCSKNSSYSSSEIQGTMTSPRSRAFPDKTCKDWIGLRSGIGSTLAIGFPFRVTINPSRFCSTSVNSERK